VFTKKNLVMPNIGGGYDFWITPENAFIILNDGVLAVSYPFATSTLLLNNGIWHHVAYTFTPNSPTGGRIYYNGFLV